MINGGCAEESHTALLQQELSAAVSGLYLGKHGKEYPYYQFALDRCMEYQYQPCLEAYQIVENAKEKILSIPDELALATILNMIQESCDSEDEIQANYVCHGSIMALYFYSNADFDRKILSSIKSYPMSIQNIIFNNNFAWFQNRTNKND